MMRVAVVLAGLALSASPLPAQVNPRGETTVTLAGKSIAIEYGRPSLKGRDMLAQAEIGQSWRLGADSATRLRTEAALAFGATVLPAGEYILTATKLADDKWQLNVRDKERAAVATIPLVTSKLDSSVETFTIELKEDKGRGHLSMSWGDTALSTSFSAE